MNKTDQYLPDRRSAEDGPPFVEAQAEEALNF